MQGNLQEKENKKIPFKLTKNNCLILVLAGILLLVIAWPTDSKRQKEETTNSNSELIFGLSEKQQGDEQNLSQSQILSQNQVTAQNQYTNTQMEAYSMLTYASSIEEALENILSSIEGAGKVKVMVTLKSSQETVVEKDVTRKRTGTTEVDSAGGSRNTTDITEEEKTLYTDTQTGISSDAGNPYVKKILAPQIAGVVVSAQGGGNAIIAGNISEAIQVLFGLDAHKIKIVKMISD